MTRPIMETIGLAKARLSELRSNPRNADAYRDLADLFERDERLTPSHIESTPDELNRFRVSTGSGTREIHSPH